MSDDQIIRTPKRHEVSIPEGSNNASSQKSIVGVRETEVSSTPSQASENAQGRHTVRVQEDSEADRRIAPGQEAGSAGQSVPLPGQDALADNRALLPEDGQPNTSRVALPAADALQDNHVALPPDAQEDNVVKLDSDSLSTQRAAVSHESLHDTHAKLPDMSSTSDNVIAIDSERITDPDRVLVEGSMPERAGVDVPVADESHQPVDAHENVDGHNVVHMAPEEHTPAAAVGTPTESETAVAVVSVAQVTSHLSDKKAEEFRGRVVKLRDEVDQLNRRLDEIEKFEI